MAQAEQQPAYGSDDYVNSLAQKYNVDPDYVRKNLDRSATEVVGGMVMSPELANKGAAGLAAHPVGRHRCGQRALSHRNSLLSLLY